jgi:hypothetical protein
MHDPHQAAQELRRAVKELNMVGAMLNDFQSAGEDGNVSASFLNDRPVADFNNVVDHAHVRRPCLRCQFFNLAPRRARTHSLEPALLDGRPRAGCARLHAPTSGESESLERPVRPPKVARSVRLGICEPVVDTHTRVHYGGRF